jgi:hypothetical protein
MVRTINKPHTPLIIIGGGVDEKKSIIFSNCYVNIDDDNDSHEEQHYDLSDSE